MCEHGYKFGSEIAHYLYELAGIQGQDEEIGSTDELGWYALFTGPFDVLQDGAVDTDVIASLDAGDIEDLSATAGAILSEDDAGFVSADLYSTPEALAQAWSDIQGWYEEAYGPQEDDITSSNERDWYQYGSLVVTVLEDEDRDTKLLAYMERQGFYPNVWVISDHGNAHLLTISQE